MLNVEFAEALKKSLAKGLQQADEMMLEGASANGNLDKVKEALQSGVNVHAFEDGPLRLAALNGHFEIVKTLLNSGANPSARNNEALRWARAMQHNEVEWLLFNAIFRPGHPYKFECT